MFGTKSSNLNPLANTFVPSNSLVSSEMSSDKKVSTQSLASKLIQDLLDNKRNNSDKAVTQEDFLSILEKLIQVRYEIILEDSKLMSYLTAKIPKKLSIKLTAENGKESGNESNKTKSFDLSVFKVPKASILLVTLWGLYRHEQAMRPTLSLTYRPENLKDPIWSVTSNDLKIWNPRAVESTCNCPPMFGYKIPVDFFGNPFNLSSSCSKTDVHLNHYTESTEGNELTLFNGFKGNQIPFNAFADYEDAINVEYNMEYYSEQMKDIVNSVCNLLTVDEDANSKCLTSEPSDITYGNFVESLWDSNLPKFDAMKEQIEEDDDYHPLLEAYENAEEEFDVKGTLHEVEEILQRSLSMDSTTDNANLAENATKPSEACDPPCSVWCNSHPISRSTSVSSDIISFLNDTTEFLLNDENFASKDHPGDNKLKTVLPNAQKACFRRSFSVNDCDIYDDLYKTDTIPQVSTSTREALAFLRKDPINFFKRLRNRNDSWMDNDSGILSQCSSQEEIFSDGDPKVTEETGTEYEDPCSMWGFFNGEGSLWKPLPSSTQPNEQIKIPHKRVRDLRRQRSIN